MGNEHIIKAFHRMPQACMFMDTDLKFIDMNETYCRAVQRTREEMLGRNIFDVFPDTEARIEPVRTVLKETLHTGAVTQLSKQPYKFLHPNGDLSDHVWDIEHHPILSDDGKIVGLVQFCEDITEREAYRQELDLVSAELNHRVRNTLAVVQSVAEHTGETSKSIEHFIDSFSGRLSAMGRNFAALSDSNWQGLDLESVIRTELEPYAGATLDRITIQGPSLTLSVKATKDASMIFHELITNASKYGFLSSPRGRLDLSWDLSDNALKIAWLESGLSGVEPPTQTGFGFQLFDMFPNLKIRKNFASDGLKIWAVIPVDTIASEIVFAAV